MSLEDADNLVTYTAEMIVSPSLSVVVALLLCAGKYIPVMVLTWATPWASLRTTPICEGAAPFLASLQIWSAIWSGEALSHEGGFLE